MRTRNMLQVVIAIAAILAIASSSVSPVFAYSSSAQTASNVGITCNEVEIFNSTGEEYISIINKTVYYQSGSGSYSFISGTVSEGLYLTINGTGNFALGVIIDGASTALTSVDFVFGSDTDLTVSVSNGSGSAYIGSKVYSAGTSIPFSVSIGACSGSSSNLSLGNVKFVMVPLGTSTTVPGDLVLEGTSTNIGENSITTELKSIIKETGDVQEAIESVNNGSNEISGTVGNDEKTYYVRETDDVGGYPAVLVSTNESGSNNIAPTGNGFSSNKFSVDIPIPSNVYCLVAVTVMGTLLTENYLTVTINGISQKVTGNTWSNTTYYLYISGNSLTQTKNIPSVDKWINSGNGLEIEVDGSKNSIKEMTLEVRILMQSIES